MVRMKKLAASGGGKKVPSISVPFGTGRLARGGERGRQGEE